MDGTISGWAPQSDLNNAIIAASTPGAVYTGLAITSKASGNFLFAVGTASGRLAAYRINGETGVLTPLGAHAVGQRPAAVLAMHLGD